MDKVEAVAEAWASIDGKLEVFRQDKADPLSITDPDYSGPGTYAGYMEEAEEMIRRLVTRGFLVLPREPDEETVEGIGRVISQGECRGEFDPCPPAVCDCRKAARAAYAALSPPDAAGSTAPADGEVAR